MSVAACLIYVSQGYAASPIVALASQKPKAEISFDVTPSSARILLPGLQRELKRSDALPKGRFLIEISAAGFESERFWIDIEDVDPQHFSVSLTPKSESISLAVWPPGSSMRWMASNGSQGEVAVEELFHLALGDYQLVFSKAGYISQQHTVKIVEGGQHHLKVSLAPIPKVHGEIFSDVLRDGGNGPRLVALRGGSYLMGDSVGDGDWREGPVHEVRVDDFAITTTEITRGDYQRYLSLTGLPTQALSEQEERLPATHINYYDASAYAEWLSAQTGEQYSLPTEAEWEYAARAGSLANYSFGNNIQCDQARYDGLNRCGSAEPAPVASYPPNAFGIHDMHGNVWEWTKDCATEDYSDWESTRDTKTEEERTCHRAMLRGGSFNLNAHKLRVSYRSWRYKDYRHNDTGFRLVRRIVKVKE